MAGKKNGEPLQGLGTITENEKDSRVRYMPRPFERPLFLALQPPFLPGVHHQGHIFQQAPQLPTLQRTHIQKVLSRPTKVAYVCSSTCRLQCVQFVSYMCTLAFRSIHENTRLAEIVDSVKGLEDAVTKDSGINSEHSHIA